MSQANLEALTSASACEVGLRRSADSPRRRHDAEDAIRVLVVVLHAVKAARHVQDRGRLYGLQKGVTYGLRDGLVLLARQRTYYVSQRGNDTWVLALTGGLRARVYRRGRASAFLQFDMGVSDAAIALPSRGTRFNYLGVGGGGVLVRLKPRLHLVTSLDLLHISNASLKSPDRNPDIESIGPTLGLIVGF